jgi:hypothetical protein
MDRASKISVTADTDMLCPERLFKRRSTKKFYEKKLKTEIEPTHPNGYYTVMQRDDLNRENLSIRIDFSFSRYCQSPRNSLSHRVGKDRVSLSATY